MKTKPKVKAPLADIPIPAPVATHPVKTAVFRAMCIAQAKNPQWVYVKADGIDGKLPVAIARRMSGKLVGKPIMVEAISDASGTSYRHVP